MRVAGAAVDIVRAKARMSLRQQLREGGVLTSARTDLFPRRNITIRARGGFMPKAELSLSAPAPGQGWPCCSLKRCEPACADGCLALSVWLQSALRRSVSGDWTLRHHLRIAGMSLCAIALTL